MLTRKHFEHLAVITAMAESAQALDVRDEIVAFCREHGQNFDYHRFMCRVAEHLDTIERKT